MICLTKYKVVSHWLHQHWPPSQNLLTRTLSCIDQITNNDCGQVTFSIELNRYFSLVSIFSDPTRYRPYRDLVWVPADPYVSKISQPSILLLSLVTILTTSALALGDLSGSWSSYFWPSLFCYEPWGLPRGGSEPARSGMVPKSSPKTLTTDRNWQEKLDRTIQFQRSVKM